MRGGMLLFVLLFSIPAQATGFAYLIGDVDHRTIVSVEMHGIPISKVCACPCSKQYNISNVVIIVYNDTPVAVLESGATLPDNFTVERGYILYISSNGTVLVMPADKYERFLECLSEHPCVTGSRTKSALLMIAGTGVLLAAAYLYNRRVDEE